MTREMGWYKVVRIVDALVKGWETRIKVLVLISL
jgi:hypothetical protein